MNWKREKPHANHNLGCTSISGVKTAHLKNTLFCG